VSLLEWQSRGKEGPEAQRRAQKSKQGWVSKKVDRQDLEAAHKS